MTFAITFLVSFIVILVVIAAMSVGVLRGRAPIKGSCGGLNGGACELCSGNCDRKQRLAQGADT